jgi:hypothetical protein
MAIEKKRTKLVFFLSRTIHPAYWCVSLTFICICGAFISDVIHLSTDNFCLFIQFFLILYARAFLSLIIRLLLTFDDRCLLFCKIQLYVLFFFLKVNISGWFVVSMKRERKSKWYIYVWCVHVVTVDQTQFDFKRCYFSDWYFVLFLLVLLLYKIKKFFFSSSDHDVIRR